MRATPPVFRQLWFVSFFAFSFVSSFLYGQDGTLDATFNPQNIGLSSVGTGPNSTVRTIAVQSDNKILIGGQFTSYNGTTRSRLARINEDGSLDAAFTTSANSVVRCIAVQPDGKIIVAGDFTTINGSAKIALVRLNTDGSPDSGFNTGTGPDGGVFKAIVLSSGKILIVGAFSNYNGVARNRVALLNDDGSLDNSFDSGTGANATVQTAAVQPDGKILIGGNFTSVNGVTRNYLARLSSTGAVDTGFDTGNALNNNVLTLSLQSTNKIIVGGVFTDYNASGRNYIVRLNTDGSPDASFVGTGGNVSVNTSVETSLVLSDDKIYIAGGFASYNGTSRNRIARLNADGSIDNSFLSSLSGANNVVYAIAPYYNNRLMLGGAFSSFNSTTINFIARTNDDGTFDTGVTGGDHNVRSTVLQSDGKLIVAGEFTTFDGKPRSRIARLNTNGTVDATFTPGTGANSVIRSTLIQSDRKIIITGDFTTYNGTARVALARLNSNGTLDTSFDTGTGPNGGVYSAVLQSDGKLIICGVFTSYNGVTRNRIARINTDGSLDTSFNPGTGANSVVRMVAQQADGKILLAGDFTAFNGATRIGLVRLNNDGSLDAGFVANANLAVYAVAVQSNQKIVITGDFTMVASTSINRIARLNTDGTVDTSFTPGTGLNVRGNVLAFEPDQQIIVAGEFASFNGTARSRIARLFTDGTLDTSLDPGTGPDNSVFSVTLQTTGIIIGGSFLNYAGTARGRLARISICAAPIITATTPGVRCDAGTVALGATASAGTVNWYTTLTGGSSSGTGTSFTTPSIGTTTTYFVGVTDAGCSSARTAVVATVNTTPTVASSTPASRCGSGTVTLAATASAGAINWFAAASGGSSLGTGTSFVTPSITVTTTYFAEASANGCASSRTSVPATINTIPTVTGTTPGARCDNGTVALSATSSAGTLSWFSASSGGSSLGTGTSFNTPTISTTTTYYVESTDNGCTSPRSSVVATVNTTPSVTGTTPASRCDAGTIALGATASAGTLNWFAASSGGSSLGTGTSFITPSIGATTNYYVDATNNGCTSARTTVIATVNTTPTITGTTPASRCDAGTVSLSAAASAGTLSWFAASSGGSALAAGTGYTTPAISTTTTYYVSATNNSCTSPRTAVVATVNTTPSITSTTPAGRCNPGTVSLSATASAGTLNWFAASTGGSSLGTGTSFTTPSISLTTTYYVEATNTSCTSARTAVTASISTTPSVTSTTPASRCGNGTVTLNAVASAGNLKWYDALSGGILLNTGAAFTTPTLTNSATYYVEADNSGCVSSRTAVAATINAVPSITATTPATRCDAGTAIISATANTGTLHWHDVNTGGISLNTGASFTTPSLAATTTYYVDATHGNGCISPRSAVVVTINNTPTVTGTSASRCDAGTVTLSGGTTAGTISWFAAPTGGSSLATGTSFTTPPISTSTPYYIEATHNGCTSARTSVTATVNNTPSVTSSSPAARCGEGVVTLGATASSGSLQWFDTSSGGTELNTGSSYAPSITSTTNYYVEATANGCTSPRTLVVATVNPLPVISSVTPGSRCGNGTLTLSAVTSAGVLTWFDVSTGGTSLATGANFTTPDLTSSATYFVEATLNSCTSPRTAVAATVTAIPTVSSTTPASRCGAGTVVLNATASMGTISWYGSATSATSLGTGDAFTTPSLNATTAYFVEAAANGCLSTSRTEVVATINSVPAAPIATSATATTCDAGTVTLTASGTGTLSWYTAPAGGTALSTGTSFVTPTLNTTTVYYVEASSQGCNSSRALATATIRQSPATPVVTANNTDPTAPVLTSSSASGNQWFKDGVVLSGATANTLTVTQPGIYTVQTTASGCTSSTSASFTYVTTAIEPGAHRQVTIYPVPATTELNIDLTGFDASTVLRLHDVTGGELLTKCGGGKALTLDLLSFKPGVYYLVVEQGEKKITQRFIKN